MVCMREQPKREMKVATRKVSENRSDEDIDYLGVLAEMAISKLLKTPLVKNRLIRGDDGYDILWKKKRIEVKYTYHKRGHLMVRNRDKCTADKYVLLTGDENRMAVLGWIDKDEFLKKGVLKDFGYGNNFVIEQEKLHHWSE